MVKIQNSPLILKTFMHKHIYSQQINGNNQSRISPFNDNWIRKSNEVDLQPKAQSNFNLIN